MTVYTNDIIKKRIEAAEPCSPIAVFDTQCEKNGVHSYDSVFAVTAMFKLKRQYERNLIGVFHKYTPEKDLAFLDINT